MTTLPNANLVVSFVISTHNRRDVLLHTLAKLRQCGLFRASYEVIVVDNASSDGASGAVRAQFPEVITIQLHENRGACAKNLAIAKSRGRYVVFLDDDSFPLPGAIARMIQHFESDPNLGAAVFTITLPNGSEECSAFPDVFIGCGTGFRRRAIVGVGGLPDDFFMQAEEYDLSLRLLEAGWEIRTFDDLHVRHLKTSSARRSWRTMRLDTRNNFLVATRFLPDAQVAKTTRDWMKRYYRIAAAKNQRSAFIAGLAQGAAAALKIGHRKPVSASTAQRFTRTDEIYDRLALANWKFNLKKILFIDYGKNILPYWQAAKSLGLEVVAITDAKLGERGFRYRGAPIVSDAIARKLAFDAAIVSNSSPVHARARRSAWAAIDDRPVIDLLDYGASPEEKFGWRLAA